MKAILMSIVLVLFVFMLIYIVSCLLRSVKKGEKSVGYLVIPIKNGVCKEKAKLILLSVR